MPIYQRVSTKSHIKSTDRNQYLHLKSSHSNHTKRSIVHSHTLTVHRICSRECEFQKHISEAKTWFLRRNYAKNLVLKRMPLAATYHPLLNSLGKVLNKNPNILYMNEEI